MQRLFRKSLPFNGLLLAGLILAGFGAIRRLPAIAALPPATVAIAYRPVAVPVADSDFSVAGAWVLDGEDRRLQGLSGLAMHGERLASVSDLGAGLLFDPPSGSGPRASIADLRDGPAAFGSKKNRDAEAIVSDGAGGWFVAFENHHSVWRYTGDFAHGRQWQAIDRPQWRANVGVEALLPGPKGPTPIAQSGREMLRPGSGGWTSVRVDWGWQVADAAVAPDGSTWLLLRSVTFGGFDEAIAPLVQEGGKYRLGPIKRFPKRAFDNFEGMAIAPISSGWRFWLVSDDGHYLWPHTVLMALELPRTQENARR